MTLSYPFADVELARRLERVEAHANRRCVEARARFAPASRASWIDVDGAYALFDGVGSPLTQTVGLGMFAPVTTSALDRIENFFAAHGADGLHEVSPLSDPSALGVLTARCYEPFEYTSVMYRPIAVAGQVLPAGPGVTARSVRDDERRRWAEVSAEGWSEFPELATFMRDIAQISADTEDARHFLVESGSRAIATGLSVVHQKVVLLAGASTVPAARRQGAQDALLHLRLGDGAEQGAELAMMCAQPGSASQRNAERQGFRIAYTRAKWRRRSDEAARA